MASKRQALVPDKFYHFYNHAVANNNLFRNDDNYKYFLKKIAEYVHPVARIYAYCLMPNHFHFLIQIRSEQELRAFFKVDTECDLSNKLSHQIGTFQNCYTKSINSVFKRKGALFMQSFGRKEVKNINYFSKLVHYIHYNPTHHGFTEKWQDWKYSSYTIMLSDDTTLLEREYLHQWFGGKEALTDFHTGNIDITLVDLMEIF